jgi:hypothetical protein
MFELPQAEKAAADGSDDEHPLKLDGIQSEVRALRPRGLGTVHSAFYSSLYISSSWS